MLNQKESPTARRRSLPCLPAATARSPVLRASFPHAIEGDQELQKLAASGSYEDTLRVLGEVGMLREAATAPVD